MAKTKSDHALAVVKAAVSAIPGVGGSLASLIGDYIPSSTERSIERTLEMLQERLERLEERVDTEGLNKDEFSELFKSCYLIIVRTHQESKLRAAANLITNILLKPGDPVKLSYTVLDHFVRCLDALSIGAIETLGKALSIAERDRDKNSLKESIRINFEDLQRDSPETEPALLMGLVGELNSFNLVHLSGAPSVRTPDYANYPIEFTPLGGQFVKYILEAE